VPDQNDSNKSFVEKALAAVPGWALGLLGLFAGGAAVLQVTGYNAPLQRIIEAHVKRLEQNTMALEANTVMLERVMRIERRQDRTDEAARQLEERLAAVETENAVAHKQLRKGR
jgi:exonuclease VII small subunit